MRDRTPIPPPAPLRVTAEEKYRAKARETIARIEVARATRAMDPAAHVDARDVDTEREVVHAE